MHRITYIFVFLSGYTVQSLNNGVARRPPMGWLSWETFRCEVDCTTYPDDCINDKLYMTMADHLVNDGWSKLGYVQVNIDDCWSLHTRDNITFQQVADPNRFPNGIKGVADYVHNLGLKLGLYNDIGTKTCGGYTGIDGNYELDANTFVSWDIDMIKIDGCNGNKADYYKMYPLFGDALNKTGKAVIYSCSWPAYIEGHGETFPVVDNTTLVGIAKYCNLWRNYYDVQNSWDSIKTIASYWKRSYSNYSNDQLLYVSAPGQWNDPDMIIAGDSGLSLAEAETQFCLYAIWAAPLLLGNDLRAIDPEMKALLQNKEIIDVNQDGLGKQGGYIYSDGDMTIWMRELEDPDSIAIVMQNEGMNGFAQYVTFYTKYIPDFVKNWKTESITFTARNLLNHTDLGVFDGSMTDRVQPNGVTMYKLTINRSD